MQAVAPIVTPQIQKVIKLRCGIHRCPNSPYLRHRAQICPPVATAASAWFQSMQWRKSSAPASSGTLKLHGHVRVR